MNSYDLVMLRAFTQVYETRSVRRSAENLFVTQPAVSYSLAKMRRLFDDPLFIRRNQQMEPTERAAQLYPRLREVLNSLDSVMDQDPEFDPAVSRKSFTLQLSDLSVHGLLPRILRITQHYAPHIRIHVEPLQLSRAADDLFHERCDAVICSSQLESPEIRQDFLFAQKYSGMCSPNHPRISGTPTLPQYLAEKHVVINSESGHGFLPLRLLSMGYELDVSVNVPSFMVLPSLLANTEFLSFAPQITAENFRAEGKVRTFDLPFDIPETEASLYTRARTITSPPHEWLRRIIMFALAGGTPERQQEAAPLPPAEEFLR